MPDHSSLEAALRDRVRHDEAAHGRRNRQTDSLWDHLQRVARLAERLGRAEGVDPLACRLTGLFHDAGKFSHGGYHQDDIPEEVQSVAVLRELTADAGLPPELVEQVALAIMQLYRDDPEPTPLARVLFDADNLDKLGPLGVANFFIKAGLRGGGLSQKLLHSFTTELTYARHAERSMMTATGREQAAPRAADTTRSLHELLRTLREDGLYDFQVHEVQFEGLLLDVVAPRRCGCGAGLERSCWTQEGIKCTEIHLQHRCQGCGELLKLRFCRPKLRS